MNKFFELPNGKLVVISVGKKYNGKTKSYIIAREYLDGNKDSVYLPKDWYGDNCPKFEEERFVVEHGSKTPVRVKDTLVVGTDPNWKEYKLVKEHDNEMRERHSFSAEIILMSGKYSRRFIINWKGNVGLSYLLNNIGEILWNELKANHKLHDVRFEYDEYDNFEILDIDMYNDDEGCQEIIGITSLKELENMVVSVRLIKSDILDS